MTEASGRRNFRMYILCAMDKSFIQGSHIIHFNPLQIGISQYRGRVVANHTTTMSRASPFREETAFLICIDETFLDLFVYRRIHQVEEREQATESIPEAGIRIHISR